MRDNEKKLTDSSKKVAEIRRVLCNNSNNELAEMLGITPQIVSNLVSGRRNLGMRTAEKILAAFQQLSREFVTLCHIPSPCGMVLVGPQTKLVTSVL